MQASARISRRMVALALCALLVAGLFVSFVFMQQGGNYEIKPSVISGGGTSSNGNTRISSTIGQVILSSSTSGIFALTGGFWQAAVPCAAASMSG